MRADVLDYIVFLIFKIHLHQIIWLSAILAFRFAFSRLHSSGLLHVTGSLANARLPPYQKFGSVSQFLQNCSTPFSSSQSGKANDESASTGGKKQNMFNKKRLLNFNAIIKLKSIHIGE